MGKNLIPEIAQMLGVTIEEEFKIKDKHSGFVSDKTYKFSENALMYFHQEDGNICRIVADSMTLCSLLNGYLEVVKLPWRPKKGEDYYTFGTSAGVWMVWQQHWTNHPFDYAVLAKGWVYHSKKEAEFALSKVAPVFNAKYNCKFFCEAPYKVEEVVEDD